MINEPQMTIAGNLTADPELRFTATGLATAAFTVAANPRFRTASGEWENGDSVFMRVTAWRNLAENIAESLRRGDPVIVIGRYRQRGYETREGEKRTSHEIQADSVSVPLDRHRVRLVKVTREAPGDGRANQDAAGAESPANSPAPGPTDQDTAGADSPSATRTEPDTGQDTGQARGRSRGRAKAGK
jgi:single-strand DNA-binding protein